MNLKKANCLKRINLQLINILYQCCPQGKDLSLIKELNSSLVKGNLRVEVPTSCSWGSVGMACAQQMAPFSLGCSLGLWIWNCLFLQVPFRKGRHSSPQSRREQAERESMNKFIGVMRRHSPPSTHPSQDSQSPLFQLPAWPRMC